MATRKPPAVLEPRPGDEALTIEELRHLSVFANLSKPPDLEQFPGAVLLRRYCQGNAICRQNDAGWTAFYILTKQDLLELCNSQRAVVSSKGEGARGLVEQLQKEI